jgi:hypothetical protein
MNIFSFESGPLNANAWSFSGIVKQFVIVTFALLVANIYLVDLVVKLIKDEGLQLQNRKSDQTTVKL